MKENIYPKLTIITVTFNSGAYLEQTILNVINQNYPNLEYIIIDGQSTDNTIDIINKYKDYISYWVSEKDNGIYDAINKGILASSGDFIGIINSDDWYDLDVFHYISNVINIESPDIIHGVLRLWANENKIGLQGYTSEYLLDGMISHPTCFVRRTIYLEIGLYDTKFKIAADYDFMLNCYFNKSVKFSYQEKVFANFRLNGISNTNSKLRRKETNFLLFKYNIISRSKFFLNNLKLLF